MPQGWRVVAVVMDRDVAFFEKEKDLLDAVAAAVLAGAAAVDDRRVALDQHRIVGLQVLAGDVLEQRPPRMAVQAVADRTARNAAIENFHELERPAGLVDARIKEVRARAVAGRGRHFRRVVAQRPAEHVELPRQACGCGCPARPGSSG